MRISLCSVVVVGLTALIAKTSGYALALTCYQIVDADDKTLYRATVPPFSLEGSAWTAAQAKMRTQRQHLMWFDASICATDYSSPLYAASAGLADTTPSTAKG